MREYVTSLPVPSPTQLRPKQWGYASENSDVLEAAPGVHLSFHIWKKKNLTLMVARKKKGFLEEYWNKTERRPQRWRIQGWGCLTLILLTWRIWWVANNASRWQMGFNSAFKGLNAVSFNVFRREKAPLCSGLLILVLSKLKSVTPQYGGSRFIWYTVTNLSSHRV
jgi:hypothetical protein